jgi:peptide/nickel transport system substrate-binding protein
MEEAGYPNGFDLKFTVPSNYAIYMSMAEVLEQQLGQIGIRVTIEPVEWGTWISDVYTARNFESTIIGFDAATLSAGAMLNRWMSTDPSNMINYDDPVYDEMMNKAMACTDDEEQTDLYKQAAARLSENAANIYIEDMADFVVMKRNVAGYQFYPLYVMDLSKIYFTE